MIHHDGHGDEMQEAEIAQAGLLTILDGQRTTDN